MDTSGEEDLGRAAQALQYTYILRAWLPDGLRPVDVALGAGPGGLRVNDQSMVHRGAQGYCSMPPLQDIPVVPTGAGLWPVLDQLWITSTSTVELGVHAHVPNIMSVGDVTLRNYAQSDSVITGGSLNLQAGASGGQTETQAAVGLSSHEYGFEFSSTVARTQDVTLNSGQSATWDADDETGLGRGYVTLNSGAHLTLKSGNYWFKSLIVNSDSTLTLDNTDGGIRILVGNTGDPSEAAYLTLRGNIGHSDCDDNILIGYAGTSQVTVTSQVPATLVAPHAKVDLYSRFQDGYRSMSVFADGVELHQSTLLESSYLEDWKFVKKPHAPMLVTAERDGEWEYPRERETYFFDGWQGVAHDELFWYSSNARCSTSVIPPDTNCHPADSHLWATAYSRAYGNAFAVTGICGFHEDINELLSCCSFLYPATGCGPLIPPSSYVSNPWREYGWDHIGDITYLPAQNGQQPRIVAPLDKYGSNPDAVGTLEAFGLTMGQVNGLTVAPIPLPSSSADEQCRRVAASWIGYNPKDGFLYMSGNDYITCLHAYSMDENGQLTWRKAVRLRTWDGAYVEIQARGGDAWIQGGAFSDSGKLYLVNGASEGGIVVIDVATGVVVEGHHINFGYDEQELEGITIWDLTDNRVPGMTGQVHVGMVDIDRLGIDQLYFKHYRATYPENL